MTENTGAMDVGEGMLWRSKVEPTSFKFYAADPLQGQVAMGARLRLQGRDTLISLRLRVDRGKILEIEQLWAGNINAAAIPLLTTPVSLLTTDVSPADRTSREGLIRAANSYFDALEGDNGKIGAFARERLSDGEQPAARRTHDAGAAASGPQHRAGSEPAQVQHADLYPTDRQQDLRLYETNPAPPRISSR
jgi:hypothetical protein